MNRRIFIIVILFGSLITASSFGQNDNLIELDPPLPSGLKIAFTSFKTGSADIFFMNPDGTGIEQITGSKDDNSYAEFVNSNTLRFFRSQNQQNFLKWDKNLTTGEEKLYEFNPIVQGAQFEQLNPNDKIIAYVKDINGINELFLYNKSTNTEEQITYNQRDGIPAHSLNHEWSRDGKKLAFMSGPDWYNQFLRVYNVETRETKAITKRGYMNSGLLWLKDRSGLILNIKIRGNIYELWRINEDGSQLTQLTGLTKETIANIHPKLSPDGNWIVFESQRDGGESELYLMRPDGTNQIRLTFDGSYNGRPAWFPLTKR